MIATLIGIQTVCIGIATGFVAINFRPRKSNLKLISKSKGFKHYKTF